MDAMALLLSIVFGLLGGIIAWIATAVLGQPFYRYCCLRAEAARVLALYEHHDVIRANHEWRAERKRAYQACGSQLMAFAATNVLMTTLLQKMSRHPRVAGETFVTLSELSPDHQYRLSFTQRIIAALRLKLKFTTPDQLPGHSLLRFRRDPLD